MAWKEIGVNLAGRIPGRGQREAKKNFFSTLYAKMGDWENLVGKY